MSDLTALQDKLSASWETLRSQWQTTSAHWNDAARFEFEREFMDSYEGIVRETTRQIESLAQDISRAYKQLE